MNTLAHPPTPISEALSLPGATFTRSALHIDPSASPKQLKLIGDFLTSVGDSSDWWKSDYVQAVAERNPTTKKKEDDDPHAKARTICQEQGLEQGAFDFYLSVSEMFPPDLRIEALSFEHHKEALIGTNGSAVEARQWLAKALEESMDVPALRKALRLANATYHADKRPPTGNGYSAIIDAERWARTQEKELATYTPERAKAVLSDMRHLRHLIDTLEAIAGELP